MSVNGVYIVMGETNTVVALLNKARRQYQLSHQPPSLEDTDPLMRNFADLKEVLNSVSDLLDMNPITYLSPFLDVIKAQNTNGPITEAALASVAKFLTYGLIDASSIKASNAVNSIADAVVHTKFIGGKSSGSDECVLFKILLVLRSLLLSPPGSLLSNESVCDMMQSCFRIVFEQHLSPLLRKAAEATLTDTTQLIFTRLSTFREDTRHPYIRYLVMNSKTEKRRQRAQEVVDSDQEEGELSSKEQDQLIPGLRKGSDGAASQLGYDVVTPSQNQTRQDIVRIDSEEKIDDGEVADSESEGTADSFSQEKVSRHRNKSASVVSPLEETKSTVDRLPYGLPCCRELLRFLIALVNPLDRANTESMVILGLNLITVALEAAGDHLIDYAVLMPLIRDNLCRSLLQLLDTEKLPVLAATNRVCFLLFESMRNQLKFQLETYFHKLMTVIRSEQRNASYEQKEMALESLVQLWRIPGLVNELYLNYDCDIYCSNVFEELTELLKDMSFPMSGLGTTSLLALDALLVVIDTIEENCVCRRANLTTVSSPNKLSLELPTLSGMEVGKKIIAAGEPDFSKEELKEAASAPTARPNRHAPSGDIPLLSDVIQKRDKKRILAEGTDIFNKDPKQGITFLREKGILEADAASVVKWLRTNPQLDKKKIADYICSRKNSDVLASFVQSFPFENLRLDEALRIFLESFRLPGESAEISMVMQQFSEQWYKANNEPFNHVDAAFTLSYAVIMLNTDQHNPQARRNQPPMTVDCFRRNLSGTNGGQDFNYDMIVAIYNAIKSEEIVMPAEQTGIVKENYLWKVLLRRGETSEGVFLHAPTGWNDQSLFALIWGPTISSLSYVFGKTDHDVILKRALNGYRKCASIAACFGMENVFDNLVITLCKFSTFIMKDATVDDQDITDRGEIFPNCAETIALQFGENYKAQEALRVLFELVHKNGDILRESWINLIHSLLALFQAQLLPTDLTEVDDFVDEKGWVSIIRTTYKDPHPVRNEAGLLSWFGLGSGTSEAERRKLTEEQINCIKLAKEVVKDCTPSQLIRDSKYLTASALNRLVIALREVSKTLLHQKKKRGEAETEHEDILVFLHELIVSITLENKDRLAEFWADVKEHIVLLLSLNKYPVLVERAVVGILRIANRNLFRDPSVADDVFVTLSHLLNLSPKALFIFSRQISNGLHELLRNNAQDIHRQDHWQIIFSLMETTGAARVLDDEESTLSGERNAYSDVERPNEKLTTDDKGYTSDNYHERACHYHHDMSSESRADSAVSIDQSKDWIHLDKKDADKAIQDAQRALFDSKVPFNRASLVLRTHLGRHEPAAFLKICDCLDFLLRESAPHITPDNLESSINCLLSMVEASLDGGRYAAGPLSGDAQNPLRSNAEERRKHKHFTKKELSTDVPDTAEGNSDEQQMSASYQQVSLHLLDLCSNLHGCAYEKLVGWAREDPKVACDIPYIWRAVWRPLLQVMARLACDCRRRVREIALAQLQRSFLNMPNLEAEEWESCFTDVLFPLLSKLLEPFSAMDPLGREDTRVRAIQIVAKTLLNRLKELSSLPSFSNLWLNLLDFMEKYLRIDTHGTLTEAVPESLKNMLLVLDNSGLFVAIPGLYGITTQRINSILPQLIRDTIPNPPQLPVITSNTNFITDTATTASSSLGSQILQTVSAVSSSEASTSVQSVSEIPLTEVVVHSGAASPVSSFISQDVSQLFPEQSNAPDSHYSNQNVYDAPKRQESIPQYQTPTMTYASNPYYANYVTNMSQTGVPPLHMPQYINQQHQHIMPQADLSKVFAGGHAPQFIPPQELLQSSYAYQNIQPAIAPLSQYQVQPFAIGQSARSAFQPIVPEHPNNTTGASSDQSYERP